MDCGYGDHISECLKISVTSIPEALTKLKTGGLVSRVRTSQRTYSLCLATVLTLLFSIDLSLSGIVVSMILTIACRIVEIDCHIRRDNQMDFPRLIVVTISLHIPISSMSSITWPRHAVCLQQLLLPLSLYTGTPASELAPCA